MNELKRVNIRVTEEIHQYFKDKSVKTGVSMSSLMYLALEEYVNQRNVVENVPGIFSKMEELESLIKKASV